SDFVPLGGGISGRPSSPSAKRQRVHRPSCSATDSSAPHSEQRRRAGINWVPISFCARSSRVCARIFWLCRLGRAFFHSRYTRALCVICLPQEFPQQVTKNLCRLEVIS